jgi:NADPH-dependent 2,4-dienoyl-CoA reductase/sulfur reductase-like enzyme
LPYYIGEVITDKEKLLVQTPEAMRRRFNIDVRVFSEVMAINPAKKQVKVRDIKRSHEYTETYDKLVLSPGASPVVPRIEGADAANVFTLRNVTDTFAIKDFVDQQRPKRAVVVGGGFIGLEIVENLYRKGIPVTILELLNQVLGTIDYEMASLVHIHLRGKGVKLHLGDGIKQFAMIGILRQLS